MLFRNSTGTPRIASGSGESHHCAASSGHGDLELTSGTKNARDRKQFTMFLLIGTFLLLSPVIVIYLWLVNRAIVRVPKDVLKISPRRWTKKEIMETFERIEKNPIDFKPHL